MTFKINNVDFSNVITAYGYATSMVPVFTESLQTLDGVEHVRVIRYRGTLKITVKPLTGAELSNLTEALTSGILNVTYTCLQRGRDVEANMRLDPIEAELLLKNASRMLYGNTSLTFTEL